MTRAPAVSRNVDGVRPHWVIRILVVLVGTAVVLLLSAAVLPGLEIDGWWWSVAAAVLLGLVNALLWPLIVRVALPLTVLTLGLFPLVLNGVMVALVGYLLPGVHVNDVWTGLATTLVLAITSSFLMTLLSIDDDEVWTRRVLRRAARRAHPDQNTDVPGVVFIQIDGLGHDVVMRAIRDGNAPTLASWLRTGTHQLSRWQTDWTSQTGASQAGILMGSNHDMPAFRWLEKETGKVMVSNHPACAAELEKRHSTGRGLLHADGVSRGNIFTGDAVQSVMTMSVAGRKRGRVGSGYYSYFANPYNTVRTLTGAVAEIFREISQASAQRHADVLPRVARGGVYPFLRAFTTVISRDVLTSALVGDVCDGRAVVYADYVSYDEVAHHSGVERHESLEVLRALDRELARIVRATTESARPYRLVVLSDHGQSQGATFLQRYGESLSDVVTRAASRPVDIQTPETGGESWGYAAAALQEVGAGGGVVGGSVKKLTKSHTENDEVMLGPERHAARAGQQPITVLASGNLGLVSFSDHPGRLSRESIETLHPGLIDALVSHPGIGFVLVDSEQDGPVVLGAEGQLNLTTGEVVGADPLASFGPMARHQVLRTHGFPHCADLMVNSLWEAQTDEVAAFEELVGSHGGLGGGQTHPFVLHPVDLPMPEEGVLGAESLHQVLCGWLAALGHASYADPAGTGVTRQRPGRG